MSAASLEHRRFVRVLVAAVALWHLAALVTFGATFWVDSGVYACLGETLFSADQMKHFYDAAGLLSFSHIGLGEPALWRAAALLPGSCRWPALALFQHGLAVAATCWLFATAHRLWPSRWHLAGAMLLTLHPFYQSMHNALMTESIASSLLLLGLAATLRLLFLAERWRRDFGLLLAATALVVQFRTYTAAMLAAMAAVVLWRRRREAGWAPRALLLAACAAGALVFPIYRLMLTGLWVVPGVGTNLLVVAMWADPQPSGALRERLRSLGYLSEGQIAEMLAPGFDYNKAAALGGEWLAGGASLDEVNRRVASIRREIQADSPGLWVTKLRCGLASAGFPWLAYAGPDAGPGYMRMPLPTQQRLAVAHYHWLTWTSQNSYRGDLDWQMLGYRTSLFNSADGQRALWEAERPFANGCPARLRDPLGLGLLPLDFFAALGVMGIGLCLWRQWLLGVVLALPMALNFAIFVAIGVGGARYSYGLFPVGIFAFTAGLVLVRRPTVKERFRKAERIALGTACIQQSSGWLASDQGELDVTRRRDFARYWKPGTRRAFLAEHVWEHLTPEQADAGVRNCFEYLQPGGRLRLAVPDGHFPDAEYREYVRPGGTGPGADDHKVLWTSETLSEVLRAAGFEVRLLEHWDAEGHFHAAPWSSEDGHVARSQKHDRRNADGVLRYTSLIVDGIKPTPPA